jgi:tetratricopeptide (TPR) repeat protein
MVLLPEQGRLEETALPVLLLDLHRARFCGSTRLVRERVEKGFLFREGIPVFAESNLTSESLGVQLMDAGKISRSDYSRVVEHVEREGCKEGKALLDLELIEPRELFLALKEQVRTRLIECFGWAHGTFTIEPGDAPPEETQPFRADIYPLLQEGIETHWSSDRILTDLGPHMDQVAKRTALVSRIQHRLHSDAAVESFIDALDGTRTLWKALQCATTPRAMAAAWVLDAIRAMEYGEGAAADGTAEDPELPELEIVFGDSGEEAVRVVASSAAPAADASPQTQDGGRPEHPEAAALCREIAERYSRLGEFDHYALLGVDHRADGETIKRAYLAAAKDYHPDALASLRIEGAARDHANRVFAEIGRAYTVLIDPLRRREYDASLATADIGTDAEQIATAETLYRKGEILLRQGNFKGAIEFLQPAVDIYGEEADYQNALGWAVYKKMPSEPERAKIHLERAVKLAPQNAGFLFRLGVVLRSLGETVASQELLARAKQLDPNVS